MRCADFGPTPGRRPSSSMRAWTGAAYGLLTRQPSRPPRSPSAPRSRPPVTPPRRSCCISWERRRPSLTAASTRSSSISTSSGSTTSAAMCTDCTSPVPDTTTFTMPPPADPSTVASASASCAAAMSACIFCICFIIWLSWPPPPPPGIGGRPPWPFGIARSSGGDREPEPTYPGRRPLLVTRSSRPCGLLVARYFLDDGRAEALGDERPRTHRRYLRRLIDQLGEIDLLVVGRLLVERRGRGRRIGVEAVVRHDLEQQAAPELRRERLADVVRFLLEPWSRDLVVLGRYPERDDIAIQRDGLRLSHRRLRSRWQATLDLRPHQDDVVDLDVAGRRGVVDGLLRW